MPIKPAVATTSTSNLIVNGSFEDPNIPTGEWRFASSLPGWQLAAGSVIEVQDQLSNVGLGRDGQQLVELDSDRASSIYQDVPTTRAAIYQLTFSFAARPGTGPDDNVLKVSWGGKTVATLRADGMGTTTPVWRSYSYPVAAEGGITRVQFTDLGTSNRVGTLLDAVRLNPQPIAPPVTLVAKLDGTHVVPGPGDPKAVGHFQFIVHGAPYNNVTISGHYYDLWGVFEGARIYVFDERGARLAIFYLRMIRDTPGGHIGKVHDDWVNPDIIGTFVNHPERVKVVIANDRYPFGSDDMNRPEGAIAGTLSYPPSEPIVTDN
jgi:hypothetical protein